MIHRGTDPEAIKVAEKLGLTFDGMMEAYYQFTVAKGPEKAIGITFYVEDLSQVESRLAEKLKEFGIEEGNPVTTEKDTNRLKVLREIFAAKTVEDVIILKGKYRDVKLTSDDVQAINKHIARLGKKEGNPGMAPDKELLKVAIEREPLKVARQLGYEVHRLSPTDIVDKADYASGYRFRLSKAVPNQPYPQIVMARSEGEVATFLKRQTEGGNPEAKEPWQMTRDEFSKIYPFKAGADAVHRSAVFGAVYQGKPVPPEVLADYPDLQKGGNPMTEKKRHYSRPFLVNWQYGGYNYVEEDPTKPEELWPHAMVDYANPDEVIALTEKAGIAQISLAGGFWERIGYKGWGEKVSISEAKTALAKAKEHMQFRLITGEPVTGETHKERMARREEQLKRSEERLRIGREALAKGRKVLGQEKEEGNPMSDEEIDQIATKVAARVLEETAPSVLDPAGMGLLLHFTEHEIEGAGMVVNEAKARATPCNCFTYKDREYCFSKGMVGMMSSRENPEQIAEYCKLGKSYEVKPGAKQRFESFAGAAEAAHKKIEGIPKGEKLVPWLGAMSEELEKRGIED